MCCGKYTCKRFGRNTPDRPAQSPTHTTPLLNTHASQHPEMSLILRQNPSPDDTEWIFNVRLPPPPKRPGMCVHVAFTGEAIRLDWTLFPGNRIIQSDDPTKFVLASFDGLRFPDRPPSTNREYKIRFFKAGLHLNGVEYRFYGHSNSQLVGSWTCSIVRSPPATDVL